MVDAAVPSAAPAHDEAGAAHWLMHVPIPLFAMIMGLTGLGLAWRKAHDVLGVPGAVGESLLGFAATMFVLVAALYLSKAVRHFSEVKAEFNNPIRVNFFPTISISLLLLSIAALPYERTLGLTLWGVGAALHLAATVYLIGRWITRAHEITMINPAWFIPVVGNIIVPLSGVKLGFIELSWFFFSIGLVFWIILFTIVFYRIVFHNPLPGRFFPTLFILVAPPGIGTVSYLALMGGQIDLFTRVLLYSGLFLTLLNFSMARHFLKVPFFVSWWAYTFPMAAITIATLEYNHHVPNDGITAVSWTLLVVTTLIIASVFVRTTKALLGGELFVPD
ncbi:SLAC1 anion channel family protein [Pararhodospirillum oryzae]|uniref:Transporter n=1 Tax=Pararhodospirillum oryzae TaxID=478448 RepID=A0A512H5L5_9PROT|nr:SLAC1 anion channel family protein [Pararhodospirillum oryzae]GEO80765.1 transporter [Pararhodospirillum oryzae]